MAEVTFLGLGDIHGGVRWNEELAAAARSADAVLVCGDITTFGGPDDAAVILDDIQTCCDTLYAISGNCDSDEIDNYLVKRGVSLNGHGVMFNDTIGLCGVSGSNRTPFKTPHEFTDKDLITTLLRGWQEIEGAEVRLVVHHAPPHKTRCDRMRLGLHVGTRVLRSFCEEKAPDLVLCGHIHEARGRDSIGDTIVVNGGMAAKGNGSLITVSDAGIEVELI